MVKFDFEDVNLIASKAIVKSRKECDTSVQFGDFRFKIPVVPANMSAVIDDKLCLWLAKNGYFYINHRFNNDPIEFIKKMKQEDKINKGKYPIYSSISIGVKEQDQALLKKLKAQNLIPEFITIDIAHGHSIAMEAMLKFINELFADLAKKPFIIAGNIMSHQAVKDLEEWGADATKIGVGPGKACITKLKTGFGTGGWQLNALKDLAKVAKKPMIADGGIRCHGDIAKAIRFGATMIMAGSILAGHDESPGSIINDNNRSYKEYYGSASIFNKVEPTNIEGKKILVEHRGSIALTYREIEEDLQSAISYAGGRVLNDITKCDYVIVKGTINNGDDR